MKRLDGVFLSIISPREEKKTYSLNSSAVCCGWSMLHQQATTQIASSTVSETHSVPFMKRKSRYSDDLCQTWNKITSNMEQEQLGISYLVCLTQLLTCKYQHLNCFNLASVRVKGRDLYSYVSFFNVLVNQGYFMLYLCI